MEWNDLVNRTRRQKVIQLTLSFITILIWASAYVGVRMATPHFTPTALSMLRFLAASLTVLVMMPFHKMSRPALRDLPLFLLSALCAYSLYSIIMALGARTVTASVSSFIMALSPVVVPMFARLILKERLHRIQLLSVAVSATGVSIMLFTDKSFSIEVGVLWVLLGAVLFALYNIIQRLLLKRYETFELIAYSTLLGTVTLLPFLPSGWQALTAAPLWSAWVLLYLGVASTISYLLWGMALKLAAHTSEVTNFMFGTPILTTILGFAAIGELPPISAYIGGGLMLTGLVLSTLTPKRVADELCEKEPCEGEKALCGSEAKLPTE